MSIKKRLRIDGMDSEKDVTAVKDALDEFPDIDSVEIDEKRYNAYIVMAREISEKALIGALARAGYSLLKIVDAE